MNPTSPADRVTYLHAPAELTGRWLRDAAAATLRACRDAPIDIQAAAVVRETIRHLNHWGCQNGSGVVTTYEFGVFGRPLSEQVCRHLDPEFFDDSSDDPDAIP